MDLTLSSNIAKLRKEHAMTQEQLAEAVGVTFASVSKWERGVAIPELSLITKIADLFDVSLDALVGFKMLDNSVSTLDKRILNLQQQKKYDEAIIEAEKALLRYPNNFKIVYRSGELYAVSGIDSKKQKYLHRCIALLERSILLLSQNSDPSISEVSIQNKIAQCYIVLGKIQKGIDILKKYNVSGVHNALIAMTLTSNDSISKYRLDDAVSFMTKSFSSIITNCLRTMLAYANYFTNKEDYFSAREVLLWLINLIESVKIDKNVPCYLDKTVATCYCECANLSLLLAEKTKMEFYMRQAYNIAKLFDSAPTYSGENIKFYIGDSKDTVTYDDMGDSAMAIVIKQITLDNYSPLLYEIWKKL